MGSAERPVRTVRGFQQLSAWTASTRVLRASRACRRSSLYLLHARTKASRGSSHLTRAWSPAANRIISGCHTLADSMSSARNLDDVLLAAAARVGMGTLDPSLEELRSCVDDALQRGAGVWKARHRDGACEPDCAHLFWIQPPRHLSDIRFATSGAGAGAAEELAESTLKSTALESCADINAWSIYPHLFDPAEPAMRLDSAPGPSFARSTLRVAEAEVAPPEPIPAWAVPDSVSSDKSFLLCEFGRKLAKDSLLSADGEPAMSASQLRSTLSVCTQGLIEELACCLPTATVAYGEAVLSALIGVVAPGVTELLLHSEDANFSLRAHPQVEGQRLSSTHNLPTPHPYSTPPDVIDVAVLVPDASRQVEIADALASFLHDNAWVDGGGPGAAAGRVLAVRVHRDGTLRLHLGEPCSDIRLLFTSLPTCADVAAAAIVPPFGLAADLSAPVESPAAAVCMAPSATEALRTREITLDPDTAVAFSPHYERLLVRCLLRGFDVRVRGLEWRDVDWCNRIPMVVEGFDSEVGLRAGSDPQEVRSGFPLLLQAAGFEPFRQHVLPSEFGCGPSLAGAAKVCAGRKGDCAAAVARGSSPTDVDDAPTPSHAIGIAWEDGRVAGATVSLEFSRSTGWACPWPRSEEVQGAESRPTPASENAAAADLALALSAAGVHVDTSHPPVIALTRALVRVAGVAGPSDRGWKATLANLCRWWQPQLWHCALISKARSCPLFDSIGGWRGGDAVARKEKEERDALRQVLHYAVGVLPPAAWAKVAAFLGPVSRRKVVQAVGRGEAGRWFKDVDPSVAIRAARLAGRPIKHVAGTEGVPNPAPLLHRRLRMSELLHEHGLMGSFMSGLQRVVADVNPDPIVLKSSAARLLASWLCVVADRFADSFAAAELSVEPGTSCDDPHLGTMPGGGRHTVFSSCEGKLQQCAWSAASLVAATMGIQDESDSDTRPLDGTGRCVSSLLNSLQLASGPVPSFPRPLCELLLKHVLDDAVTLRISQSRHRCLILCPDHIGLTCQQTIEYLAAEVLELAGKAARNQQSCVITPEHVVTAIMEDDELRSTLPVVDAMSHGAVRLPPDPKRVDSHEESAGDVEKTEHDTGDSVGSSFGETDTPGHGADSSRRWLEHLRALLSEALLEPGRVDAALHAKYEQLSHRVDTSPKPGFSQSERKSCEATEHEIYCEDVERTDRELEQCMYAALASFLGAPVPRPADPLEPARFILEELSLEAAGLSIYGLVSALPMELQEGPRAGRYLTEAEWHKVRDSMSHSETSALRSEAFVSGTELWALARKAGVKAMVADDLHAALNRHCRALAGKVLQRSHRAAVARRNARARAGGRAATSTRICITAADVMVGVESLWPQDIPLGSDIVPSTAIVPCMPPRWCHAIRHSPQEHVASAIQAAASDVQAPQLSVSTNAPEGDEWEQDFEETSSWRPPTLWLWPWTAGPMKIQNREHLEQELLNDEIHFPAGGSHCEEDSARPCVEERKQQMLLARGEVDDIEQIIRLGPGVCEAGALPRDNAYKALGSGGFKSESEDSKQPELADSVRRRLACPDWLAPHAKAVFRALPRGGGGATRPADSVASAAGAAASGPDVPPRGSDASRGAAGRSASSDAASAPTPHSLSTAPEDRHVPGFNLTLKRAELLAAERVRAHRSTSGLVLCKRRFQAALMVAATDTLANGTLWLQRAAAEAVQAVVERRLARALSKAQAVRNSVAAMRPDLSEGACSATLAWRISHALSEVKLPRRLSIVRASDVQAALHMDAPELEQAPEGFSGIRCPVPPDGRRAARVGSSQDSGAAQDQRSGRNRAGESTGVRRTRPRGYGPGLDEEESYQFVKDARLALGYPPLDDDDATQRSPCGALLADEEMITRAVCEHRNRTDSVGAEMIQMGVEASAFARMSVMHLLSQLQAQRGDGSPPTEEEMRALESRGIKQRSQLAAFIEP